MHVELPAFMLPRMTLPLPESEVGSVVGAIRAHPEYFDPDLLRAAFGPHCAEVITDPADPRVLHPIRQALSDAAPLSAVRIGDGEANLLTYGMYPGTPTLDALAVRTVLERQADRFVAETADMVILREMMMSAVAHADIVGVKGLWRLGRPTVESTVDGFMRDPRGTSGDWRAVDYLLRLARMGWFRHKIVASAHLYLGVLEGLPDLLPRARRVLVVSSRDTVAEKLAARYPGTAVDFIPVGLEKSGERPDFLARVDAALPTVLAGCLCLVGAGPWSEIYCSWIKQRGGVGIDVGSGLDLMAGAQTRPVHKKLAADKLRRYAL